MTAAVDGGKPAISAVDRGNGGKTAALAVDRDASAKTANPPLPHRATDGKVAVSTVDRQQQGFLPPPRPPRPAHSPPYRNAAARPALPATFRRIARVLAAAACCYALLAPAAEALALPEFAELRAAWQPSDAQLLDRDGRPLHTLRVDPTVRRLAWTPLADISPALVRAVVLSEDKRFFEHGGVDWLAAGKAAWNNLRGRPTRGASTLSMQLAGLLDEDEQRRGRRSIFGKITQSTVALRLENRWTKGQIVEAYLNLVPFRGELQGVAAMSRQLFGKWPAGLDERESAIAAVLLRAPNARPEQVARRACQLLTEQDRAGECQGLEGFVLQALGGGQRPPTLGERDGGTAPQLAGHLARKLLDAGSGDRRSTLDGELQRFAATSLRQHLAALRHRQVGDGAVLVVDNASGDVLAWVGSSGDLSEAPEVDGVTALRQAGSTLKPLLYALAFETRQLTPASLIEDAPLALDTGNGLYAPQNYEPNYRGWVSARMALGGSLNVPAVKTLVRLGPDTFHARLKKNGFASLTQDGDWYGYSLALGSADVSLAMLANAYRTLANGGRWTPLRVRADGQPPNCAQAGCDGLFGGAPRAVYPPAVSFMIGDILADASARAGTFGLESWLATPYWAAVKTGTSKDMRDNWCIGFSRRYTVAVWVGNAGGEPMRDVSGISGAAPVWREVMDWLQRGDPQHGRPAVRSRPPSAPAGVVRTTIRFEPALEPPRSEWFLAGTQLNVIRRAGGEALARIAYPADGSVIALDPDIPPPLQRLPLRLSAAAGKGWQWQLDGRPLGRADRPQRWLPQPGKHRLELLDANRKTLDAVAFEVRALRGKAR
ncbi:MAG: penicillin-binding protein 1C [Azonexaceae bacterium]|nr:penicillin-binding protein 1C [Azonexaceae bacterium]